MHLAAYLTAFATTAVLVCVLAPLAHRIGLVDSPHGHKIHQGSVPLVGGIAMFCGFLFAVLMLSVPLYELRPLFAGAALLVIVGVLDDFRELGPGSRFAAQIGAGLLMALWGGARLDDLGALLGVERSTLGAWSIPFTVFSTVGVINAINMLDGMDGLAGGIALIALTALGLLAGAAGATPQSLVLFTLVSAVAAFLLFNLRLPGRTCARVFMGDAGSMFLGFCLAWFLIALSQTRGPHGAPVLAPVTALWILALPLMDTVRIMLRRWQKGRSPLSADREHLHHLLLRLGLGVIPALLFSLCAAAGLAALGIWAERLGVPEQSRFIAFLALFAAYFVVMGLAWRRLEPLPGESAA